jgi:cytochrome c oxidase subunit 3
MAHDSAHPAYLAHHFEDVDQQHEAVTLGMWVFLATEVMFFGALFLAYMVYRLKYPEGFAEASNELDIWLAGTNTVILLTSSFTMALAVHASQTKNRKALIGFLLATILLASSFLVLKGMEYYAEYEHHLIPGLNFAFEGHLAQQVKLFFVLYFSMTGIHAFHMIIGIIIMLIMLYNAWRGWYTEGHSEPIELFGLYWHFVDIVWVFVFPLIYLVGRHLQ